MTSVLYLAWRYLLFHRWKTAVLVGAIALALYIPGGLWVLARQGEHHLSDRAGKTPLLVGSRGSALELTLNGLYFRSKAVAPMKYAEVGKIADSGLGTPIPLYIRFRSREDPIVATSLDYFRFRGLRVEEGASLTRLGDCVVGWRVAKRRGLKPDDSVISSPEQAFDVAGVSPLRMRVTGVLAHSDSPDDDAIFVDMKTAWVIEGIGHGHQDVTKNRPGGPVTAGSDVAEYNEVTEDNLDSFHFHGEAETFPLSGVIVVPADEKSATRLLGRYQSPENPLQITEPKQVMDDLLATVVTVRTFAMAAFAVVGIATLLLLGLVQALSRRIRQREIEILHHLGGARWRVRLLLASEGIGVLVIGALLALGLTAVTSTFATTVIRYWLTR